LFAGPEAMLPARTLLAPPFLFCLNSNYEVANMDYSPAGSSVFIIRQISGALEKTKFIQAAKFFMDFLKGLIQEE